MTWVYGCNPVDVVLLGLLAVLAVYVAYTAYKLLSRMLLWAIRIMAAQAIIVCSYKAGVFAWCTALDHATGGTLSYWVHTSVLLNTLAAASTGGAHDGDDAFWVGTVRAMVGACETAWQAVRGA